MHPYPLESRITDCNIIEKANEMISLICSVFIARLPFEETFHTTCNTCTYPYKEVCCKDAFEFKKGRSFDL